MPSVHYFNPTDEGTHLVTFFYDEKDLQATPLRCKRLYPGQASILLIVHSTPYLSYRGLVVKAFTLGTPPIVRYEWHRRCSVRAEKQDKGTLIVISNFGGEMPRTEHNTVDDLFYPRSFGARNVVQDCSSRLRINLRQFHIHFFFVCAGLCNSTTKKRLGYANVY